MNKPRFLGVIVLIAVVGALVAVAYSQGSANAHAREAGYRLVLATSRLADAKAALTKGDNALAVFHVGAATALSDAPVVALAGGEILIDAKQPELARGELARAKSLATGEDKGLRVAIEAQEQRARSNPR